MAIEVVVEGYNNWNGIMPRLGDHHERVLKGILYDSLSRLIPNMVGDYHLYSPFVSSGTLLGLYRDGMFIPDDTDIDIDLLINDVEYATTDLKGDLIRMYGDVFTLVRTQYAEIGGIHYPMQFAFADMVTGVILDHYIYYENLLPELGVNTQSNLNEHGCMSYGVLPIEFQYIHDFGLLPVPSPVHKYLEIRYDNWKVPSKEKGIFKEVE